jgi:ribosome-associated protein
MRGDLVVTPRVRIPAGELSFAFARSGGPGGQNVNKVSSKAELRWNPVHSNALGADDRAWLLERLGNRLTNDGTLIVTSTLTRDQIQNRDDALSKLTLIVRAALDRPKHRRATKPTRASKRRRVDAKRHRSEIKRNRTGSGE